MATSKSKWGAKWQESKQAAAERFEDADLSGVFWAVALLAAIVIVWICRFILLSIEPYIALAGGQAPTPSGLWFIGWVFDAIHACFSATIAVFIWGVVNFLEIFWIIVLTNREYFRSKRRKFAEVKRRQTTEDSDVGGADMRRMRRREMKAYTWVEDWMIPVALGALAFDAVVNWQKYPIISDYKAFEVGMSLRQFRGISMANLGNFMANMTIFEFMAILLIFAIIYLKDCVDGNQGTP
jgi:hypothetical protein